MLTVKQQKAEVIPSAYVLIVNTEFLLLLFLTPGTNPKRKI